MERPWLKFYDDHVPKNLEYPSTPLSEVLDEAADRYPENTAVFFFGGRVKYGDLRARANQFAHALGELGLKRGGRLGLLLPNMPQTLISAFGAWKAGGVVFFFDPLLDDGELTRQIQDSGVETVVVLDLLLRRIDPIFSRTGLKNFIITGVRDFLPPLRGFFFSLAARGKGLHVKLAKKPNIHLFTEFLRRGRADGPPAGGKGLSAEREAAVQYTAGTQGDPKGVVLTHKNLLANLLQASAWTGNLRGGREIFLSLLPIHQALGMTLAMNLPVYWAAGAVHQPRFDPAQFLSAVKAHQPSVFPGLPSMIESVAWNPELVKHKIPSIRTFWSVGPSLPVDALENFEKKAGQRVIEAYGLTEASPLTHANPFRGKRKTGSMGIPLPDTDARIVDPRDGGAELPPGQTGELVIRGPQVMKGYWNRPEETARALRAGWLHTGDLARMDEEGFFYFQGKAEKK